MILVDINNSSNINNNSSNNNNTTMSSTKAENKIIITKCNKKTKVYLSFHDAKKMFQPIWQIKLSVGSTLTLAGL